jgi:hypothetical protein
MPQREPSGSRVRFSRAVAAGLAAALLTSCADLGSQISDQISARIGNHTVAVRALPASDGWAELPVGRWLQESGVTVTGVSFCRPEICARPGFAARLQLEGRERAVIRQIIERPETLTASPSAASTRDRSERRKAGRGKPARSGVEVHRLTLGDWSGALYALRPGAGGGNAAHVVVLARAADSVAMIAVAPERDTALSIAGAATWW